MRICTPVRVARGVGAAIALVAAYTAWGPPVTAAGPQILSFSAAPAQLPASGGTVTLTADTAGAETCAFSSTPPVEGLSGGAESVPCAAGTATVTVAVGKNLAAQPLTIAFALTAAGTGGETSAVRQVAQGVPTVVAACTFPALETAIQGGGLVTFGQDCPDLVVSSPIGIPAGFQLDLEGAGHTVVLDGGGRHQLFQVTGGNLTVVGITLTGGAVQAADGPNGPTGAAGTDGPNGTAGPGGAPGEAGGDGTDGMGGSAGGPGVGGGDGADAEGGAVDVQSGVADFQNDVFLNDSVMGGAGGTGGSGGAGGAGGNGGFGGEGGFGANGSGQNGGSGGAGGAGGDGAAGGLGARGGDGGAAYGGAIASAGTLTVSDSSFVGDTATGGDGGRGGTGGAAGAAGWGGQGGQGGFAGSGSDGKTGGRGGSGGAGGSPGTPGEAGSAGDGGDGGDGGTAAGGAIYSTGSLTLQDDTFSSDEAQGGTGGQGGPGGGGNYGGSAVGGEAGFGGDGGDATPELDNQCCAGGAGGSGGDASSGANGTDGSDGGDGGTGGAGGLAEGGAVFASGPITVKGGNLQGSTATGGAGGAGGDGGLGWPGGPGGLGLFGGYGGDTGNGSFASPGALYGAGIPVSAGGNGGNGGDGGDAGAGGGGGTGGDGGAGGSADGGAIYASAVTGTVAGAAFSQDAAQGGAGGSGGDGGDGGPGGAGGTPQVAGMPTSSATNGGSGGYGMPGGNGGAGGNGGNGANGGDGGTGGNGGDAGGAFGGAVYAPQLAGSGNTYGGDAVGAGAAGVPGSGGGGGGAGAAGDGGSGGLDGGCSGCDMPGTTGAAGQDGTAGQSGNSGADGHAGTPGPYGGPDAILGAGPPTGIATSVSNASVSASTLGAGAGATWTYGFTTSTSGALSAGSGIILLSGPSGTVFPDTASQYTVNGAPVSQLNSGGGTDSVALYVPLHVGGAAAVTVAVYGTTNPAAGTDPASDFSLATSADTAAVHPATGLTFVAPLIITTTSLPPGGVGMPYTADLTAAGGTAPYTWSVAAGSLPPGLSLDPATGTIQGSPASAGTATFTIEATDSTAPAALVAQQALAIAVGTSSIVLGVSPPSVAEGGTATVFGTVYARGTTPLPNAQVILAPSAGTVTPATVTSDTYGDFSAGFVAPDAPGEVTVTAATYGASGSAVVLVAAGPAGGLPIPMAVTGPLITVGANLPVGSVADATTAVGGVVIPAALLQLNTPDLIQALRAPGTGSNLRLQLPAASVPAGGGVLVNLPPDALAALGAAGRGLEIDTPSGDVTLPPDILGEIASQLPSGDQAQIDLTPLPPSQASSIVASATNGGTYQTAGLTVEVGVHIVDGSGQTVGTFEPSGGTVELTLPYASTITGADAAKLGLYSYDATTATWQYVPGSATDEATGTVSAMLSHLSTYAVFIDLQTFPDIQGYWAQSDIEIMLAHHVVDGVSAAAFDPAGPVTRGEFALMLARALNLSRPAPSTAPFSDVPAANPYAGAIAAAARAGLVQGYPDGTFRPDAGVSRQVMAVMVERAMTVGGRPAPLTTLQVPILLAPFTDAGQVAGWARPAVAAAIAGHIITGETAATLDPDATTTRAEAAVVIERLMAGLGKL